MDNPFFDDSVSGRIRYVILLIVAIGLFSATVITYEFAISQLMLGVALGILLYALRRSIVGDKRFATRRLIDRRMALPIGALPGIVVVAVVGYVLIANLLPAPPKLIMPPNAVWILYSLCTAWLSECIDGYLFYRNRASADQGDDFYF